MSNIEAVKNTLAEMSWVSIDAALSNWKDTRYRTIFDNLFADPPELASGEDSVYYLQRFISLRSDVMTWLDRAKHWGTRDIDEMQSLKALCDASLDVFDFSKLIVADREAYNTAFKDYKDNFLQARVLPFTTSFITCTEPRPTIPMFREYRLIVEKCDRLRFYDIKEFCQNRFTSKFPQL